MITIPDAKGAACGNKTAHLFDLDMHRHLRLGPNSCWLCLDAKDICDSCPIKRKCAQWGRDLKASNMIWGGMIFERGRPKPIG